MRRLHVQIKNPVPKDDELQPLILWRLHPDCTTGRLHIHCPTPLPCSTQVLSQHLSVQYIWCVCVLAPVRIYEEPNGQAMPSTRSPLSKRHPRCMRTIQIDDTDGSSPRNACFVRRSRRDNRATCTRPLSYAAIELQHTRSRMLAGDAGCWRYSTSPSSMSVPGQRHSRAYSRVRTDRFQHLLLQDTAVGCTQLKISLFCPKPETTRRYVENKQEGQNQARPTAPPDA